MKEKKKMKLKKFHLHPVTAFILLTFLIILLSGVLSLIGAQATYTTVNSAGNLEKNLVVVENLFSLNGIKYIVSSATKNFVSFTTLSNLLIALIGLGICQATGLFDTFIKRVLIKIDNRKLTFLIIFLATISSLINDIGYVILIPLAAITFHKNNRNPLAGIIAAFCGVAFGYGVTLFVGSMEVNLVPITEASARLIDSSYHVALTSNLIIIIITSIILSVAGTLIMEKVIIPKLGKYSTRIENDFAKTTEMEIVDDSEKDAEQRRLKEEIYERKGMKSACVTAVIFTILFIYSLIPNLPFSGLLLDMEEVTYLGQVFGPNAYFQDGFTFVVSLFFICIGLAYGFSAKTIKNDKDLILGSSKYIQEITLLIPLVFFATEFVAIFRKTNIATLITAWGANLINSLNFTGLPLVVLIVLVLAIVNLFNTPTLGKWTIFAPIVVPKLMQSNISPEFGQFILRATDSMTNGITPLLTYFVIFIGYLNIYNPNKNKPFTIGKAIKLIMPYCLIISLVWFVIIILWYLTGLPIATGITATL